MSNVKKQVDWLLGATVGLCWTALVLLGIGLGTLVAAVPSLFIFQGRVIAGIARKHPAFTADQLPWLLAILVGATLIVGLAFLFVKTLLDMVTSVGNGDPLTMENAARLEKMGWIGIGIQGVGLVTGMVTWRLSSYIRKLDMDFGIHLSGIILILLLFILARVFRAGAAMRAELDGTV